MNGKDRIPINFRRFWVKDIQELTVLFFAIIQCLKLSQNKKLKINFPTEQQQQKHLNAQMASLISSTKYLRKK